ncbi:ankyrin repeat domain-containing protein, partial [Thiolapillus sp.]|uniref:ankyrin repeat domain-containing protein n=1 Tax=Thiolapillus sp. TaxID=2017437 RepID=UPI003AF9E84D
MRWLFYLTLFSLPLIVFLTGNSEKQLCVVPPLVTAAEKGDLAAVEQLLDESGTPDLRDSCDWTPLMKAALNGHVDIVRRLIAEGAEIDAQDKGGYTALMLAASNNHVKIVELLIAAGADVDHREHTRGWSALEWV